VKNTSGGFCSHRSNRVTTEQSCNNCKGCHCCQAGAGEGDGNPCLLCREPYDEGDHDCCCHDNCHRSGAVKPCKDHSFTEPVGSKHYQIHQKQEKLAVQDTTLIRAFLLADGGRVFHGVTSFCKSVEGAGGTRLGTLHHIILLAFFLISHLVSAIFFRFAFAVKHAEHCAKDEGRNCDEDFEWSSSLEERLEDHQVQYPVDTQGDQEPLDDANNSPERLGTCSGDSTDASDNSTERVCSVRIATFFAVVLPLPTKGKRIVVLLFTLLFDVVYVLFFVITSLMLRGNLLVTILSCLLLHGTCIHVEILTFVLSVKTPK